MAGYVGRTVVLWGCPGHDRTGRDLKLSGLFDIEDADSNRGQTYYMLVPHGIGDLITDDDWYDVDNADLVQQIDPADWGRYLQDEHDMDLAWEREDNAQSGKVVYAAGP